jgi:uncharacterized protein with NAD-binding domain and iron-sulfur cluster
MLPTLVVVCFSGAHRMMMGMRADEVIRRVAGIHRMCDGVNQRTLLGRQQQGDERQAQPSCAQQPVTEVESQHQSGRYRATGTASVRR